MRTNLDSFIGDYARPGVHTEVLESEPVYVGDLLAVFPKAQVTALNHPHDGCGTNLELTYDPELGRIVATAVYVAVKDRSGRDEVTGALLRDVRVKELVQQGASWMVVIADTADEGRWRHGAVIEEDILNNPPTDRSQRVQAAADLYTLAYLTNDPPIKLVSQMLKVSHSTATRLVAEARKNGILHLGGNG